MKKKIAILLILSTIGLLFANGYSAKEQGTYIPLTMYETVKEWKSYYKGISATSSKDFYTVLCVTENEILSNVKFHDAFKLNNSEINFSFITKKGKKIILDNKTGIEYIKISNSTDYYSAYNDFLTDFIVKPLAKANPTIKLKKSIITIVGENWIIDKDQWHYSEDLQIILYSETSKRFIGFEDYKIYLLENVDDLQKVIASEIN